MSEFVDCRTCKTDCVRADGNYGYTFCDEYTHPPITNADRIRSMTDEELAVFFTKTKAALYRADLPVIAYSTQDMKDNLEWLQEPAEGE